MVYPKISIVTPSFNQGRYIEETIQSVISQNYPNLEYIIIDGGSTDNTLEIIRKYDHHISFWVSEPDSGQTAAINKGFEKCSGEIVNWLNSDDYYEPGTFLKLARLFTDNPWAQAVCGREWSFNDADQGEKTLNGGSVIGANVFETIRIGIMDQPCTFFRKKSIDVFFPLNTSLHYVMDRQLWWCYLLKYGQDNILRTDEVFTNFRLHPQSKSIGEASRFEAEFDRLKLSLFRQLNAPGILVQQVAQNELELRIQWEVCIAPVNYILAAFASFFAERQYINKGLKASCQLINLVKKWKRLDMNKKEWKIYMATNLLPAAVLMGLKKWRQ